MLLRDDGQGNRQKRNDENTNYSGEGNGQKKKDKFSVKCFNCGQMGHFANRCPSNALLCHEVQGKQLMKRSGFVEDQAVNDIVLDTGCSQTMVHKSLVPTGKRIEGEAAVIRCAHGDTTLYPLAQVMMEVGLSVRAAVSESLPVSVLLGTDIKELGALLNRNLSKIVPEEVALVVTRA